MTKPVKNTMGGSLFGLAITIAAMSCPAAAVAQQNAENALAERLAPAAIESQTDDRILGLGQNIGSSSDGVQTQGPTVTFLGSEGGGRGSFTLELLSGGRSGRVRSDGALTVASDRVALEFATSIDDDADSADFVNLGGVTGGTSATLNWTHFSARTAISGTTLEVTSRLIDRARRVCFDRALPDYREAESTTEFMTELLGSSAPSGDIHDSMFGLRNRYPGVVQFLSSRCYSDANDAALIETYLTEADRDSYQQTLFGDSPLLFFGASATFGTDNYDFIDIAGFSKESRNKIEWSVSGHVGMIAANGQFSARATASYGREWDDADDVDICRPQPSGPLSDCLRGPGAPPTHQDQFTAKGEVRIIVPLGSLELGLAPSVAYQTGDDQFTAALPIYFVPDSDGKLTGGIRFGYDSEAEDEWSAGVFVSVPLSTIF